MNTLGVVLYLSSTGVAASDPFLACSDTGHNKIEIFLDIRSNDPLIIRIFAYEPGKEVVSGMLYFYSVYEGADDPFTMKRLDVDAERYLDIEMRPWISKKIAIADVFLDIEKPLPDIPDGSVWMASLVLRAQPSTSSRPRIKWECFDIELSKKTTFSGKIIWSITPQRS